MFRNLADNPLLLILLVLIVVLVFGANRLPGAARSLGRSMRIFKAEVRDMKDDDRPDSSSRTSQSHGSQSHSAPLEGRVVDPAPGSSTSPQRSPESGDTRRDA